MSGIIKLKTFDLPLDAYRVEYELVGDAPYKVDRRLLPRSVKQGDTVVLGAYRFILSKEIDWTPFVFLTPDSLSARIGYVLECVRGVIDNVYRRAILTLHVWGLAERSSDAFYQHPSWRDIRLVKRLQKRGK